MKEIIFSRKDVDLNDVDLKTEKIIALGKFNSFHLGHKDIFNTTKKIATEKNLEIVIMLYPDHKDNSKIELKNIIPYNLRAKLLNQYNVKYILNFEENFENYQTTREEFIEFLKRINVKEVVVGKDFTFNKGKTNDFELLRNNFALTTVEVRRYNNQIISTSLLESLLKDGDMKNFKELSGYNFFYNGKVIHGKKLASTYNLPTANISIDKHQFIPKQGIYMSKIKIDNIIYPSITSISNNPTFEEENISLETHILNFNKEIYGKKVTVYLLDFVREPIKFESVEKLFDEIRNDRNKAVEYFLKNK